MSKTSDHELGKLPTQLRIVFSLIILAILLDQVLYVKEALMSEGISGYFVHPIIKAVLHIIFATAFMYCLIKRYGFWFRCMIWLFVLLSAFYVPRGVYRYANSSSSILIGDVYDLVLYCAEFLILVILTILLTTRDIRVLFQKRRKECPTADCARSG